MYKRIMKVFQILFYLSFSVTGSIAFVCATCSLLLIVFGYGYSFECIDAEDVQKAYISDSTFSEMPSREQKEKFSKKEYVVSYRFSFPVSVEFYNQITNERKILIRNIWLQKRTRKFLRILLSPQELNGDNPRLCSITQEDENTFVFSDPHISVPVKIVFSRDDILRASFSFRFSRCLEER